MKIRHLFAGVLAALFAIAPAASADSFDESKKLRRAVTLDGILQHERKLQRIADAHQGNRAAATIGYEASVEYVADTLDVPVRAEEPGHVLPHVRVVVGDQDADAPRRRRAAVGLGNRPGRLLHRGVGIGKPAERLLHEELA